MFWLDGLVQGILLGGLYAQYALGMALMFGVMRIVNITHGDLITLLALVGISLSASYALGPWSVLVILVVVGGFIGWLLQTTILNRVVGADPLPSLIATFGLSVAMQNAMQQIWTADARSLNGHGIEQASFQIGPLFVGVLPLIVLATAAVLTGGLDGVLRFSRFGRSLRASAADVDAAAMSGVNPKAVYAGATAIAVAILGFAAVFQSLRATVAPAAGPAQLIYAFEAVIIGGMGSIWGSFFGAMIVGVSQSIAFRINPGFGILAGHLVFLIVLGLRPQGFLGRS
jgi:branched-chain amino acid transport system permease protein